MKENIKIGDIVKRARGGNHGKYTIGQIGEIIALTESHNRYIVTLKNDKPNYTHDSCNLDLVESVIINNYSIY